MWYQDISGCVHSVKIKRIAHYFDCSSTTAWDVMCWCTIANQKGSQGTPFAPRVETREQFAQWFNGNYNRNPAGLDCHDLADLVRDAWLDGIQRKDRVTVRLSSDTDGCCTCGQSVPSYHDKCSECGSTEIDRNVMVEVEDTYAHEWADHDGYINGSSWETPRDMPGFAYTIISDYPALVSDLRSEGYKLDLTHYTTHETE